MKTQFSTAFKSLNATQLRNHLGLWRFKDKQLVFTNGCFDILHLGHITYLEACKSLGDVLIVGLNDDDSIKRLKGNDRPINPLNARIALLSALQCIDAVVVFGSDTPLELIKNIQPNVLCKGGDYNLENIVGADSVIQNGGSVNIIPFVDNFSTTEILKKIVEM